MICWALHDLLGATDPHLNDTHGRARGYVATSDDDERRDDVAGEAAVAVIAEDRQRGVVGLPHQERRENGHADVDAMGQRHSRKRGRQLRRP